MDSRQGANTIDFTAEMRPFPERAVQNAVQAGHPQLARIIDAWPTLPDHARQTIIAILDSNT